MSTLTMTSGEVLTGRESELAVLGEALRRSRSGDSRIVVIEGPAGIGKSALLSAFVRRHVAGGHAIWLRCEELEQAESFAAAGVLLADPDLARFSELEVGRRLVTRLGDEIRSPGRSTVLVIDDAQWLDAPSARALRFALGRLGIEPFLALVARRPGTTQTDFPAQPPESSAFVRLSPLDRDAIRLLARRSRGWDISARAAERLVRWTDGLPLLVTSVLRNTADLDQLETWTDVPSSAASAVTRMLDPLAEDGRRVVDAAAVLAEPVDLVTLAGVADVADPAVATHEAVRSGLLRLDGDGSVSSAHVLLREAVYEALPLSRRRLLHARAADWTVGARRLSHRAAALDRADPALVADLLAAAEAARATRRYDLAAALRLRARSVSQHPLERDELLLEALVDRVSAQDLDGADELGRSAAEVATGPLRSFALGLLARERGEVRQASSWLQEAAATPEARDVRQRAAVAAATLYVRTNEGARAVEVLGDIGAIEEPELACDAITYRGIGRWLVGEPAAALEALRAVPLSRDGTPWEAELIAVRAMIHTFDGSLDDALVDLDRTIDLVHLWRPSTNQSRTFMLRSYVRSSLGDWDGAVGDAAAARALAENGGQIWSIAWARAISIDVPARRGLWDIAEHHLSAAKAAVAGFSNVHLVDAVGQHETVLALARGDHERVRRVVDPLRHDDHLEQMAPFGAHRWVLPAWIVCCLELGRIDDAEAGLEHYEETLRRWPGGPLPARLGWLRGLLAQARGNPDGARSHFRGDLEDPDVIRTPFLHAQVAHSAGRLEWALKNRREAISQLTAAADVFVRLEAAPYLQRCRQDLADCGLRSGSSNPRVLTEREEDVAALVARGYTNKEVARELFVSTKAVEAHLNRIYAKLGISRRQQLRRRPE